MVISTFLLFVALSWANGQDDVPCKRYQILDMHEGQRHVDFTPPSPELHYAICDQHETGENFWYRLVHDGENFELANECLPLHSCGTHAPIWMVGDYPTQAGVTVQNGLCANYAYQGGSGQCTCESSWASKKVDVQLCEDGHGGDFYIHRFDDVPSCTIGFCVQNHPEGTNVHDGDVLKCDEKNDACTSVTIVLDTTISSLTSATVYCNFVDQSGQNHIKEVMWRTTTTVQCAVPTTNTGGRLYGLFTVHVIQTFATDPSESKKSNVQVLIYDSTCQECDETTCELKDRMCLVNGRCCQGNQCDSCPGVLPDTSTTSTTSTTTSVPTTTESGELTSTGSSTGSSAASLLSTSTTTSTYMVPELPDESSEDPDGGLSVAIWIAIPIIVIFIIAVIIFLVCYWNHKNRKQRETRANASRPPQCQTPNPVYAIEPPPPYPNGFMAAGGYPGGPVKAPLDDMWQQNSKNEKQYMDEKLEKETRMQQVLSNYRDSDNYDIPSDILNPGAQTGILPQEPVVTEKGQLISLPYGNAGINQPVYENDPKSDIYHQLSHEKGVEHPYGKLTPVDAPAPHAVPNTYQVLPPIKYFDVVEKK